MATVYVCSLITGEPRSATVSAATEVSLLSLYAEDFQMLSSSNPEIAEVIRAGSAQPPVQPSS